MQQKGRNQETGPHGSSNTCYLTKQKTYDISFCDTALQQETETSKPKKQESKKQTPRTFQEAACGARRMLLDPGRVLLEPRRLL